MPSSPILALVGSRLEYLECMLGAGDPTALFLKSSESIAAAISMVPTLRVEDLNTDIDLCDHVQQIHL